MKLDKISSPLRQLLMEREIIARCELLLRIYDIVNRADLSDQESDELKKMVGDRIAPGIFASIMGGEPVFPDLPGLDTYTQMKGRIFHFLHTKRYSKQDFGNANSKFLQSIPDLRRILRASLAAMLKEFMEDAGYSLTRESGDCLRFTAGERTAEVRIATSVRSLDPDAVEPEAESEMEAGLKTCAGDGVDRIILVPGSESLEPFMQFYREKGARAEEKEIQIWLASLEKGTIDPFVGYTTDLDIYRQFKNPRLAEMVRSNWGQTRS